MQLFVHSQDQKICCSPCVELNDCKEIDLGKEHAKNLQEIVRHVRVSQLKGHIRPLHLKWYYSHMAKSKTRAFRKNCATNLTKVVVDAHWQLRGVMETSAADMEPWAKKCDSQHS